MPNSCYSSISKSNTFFNIRCGKPNLITILFDKLVMPTMPIASCATLGQLKYPLTCNATPFQVGLWIKIYFRVKNQNIKIEKNKRAQKRDLYLGVDPKSVR